jgi:hypothetical protein
VDGEIDAGKAVQELSAFDDPIARMDFIPALERMRS